MDWFSLARLRVLLLFALGVSVAACSEDDERPLLDGGVGPMGEVLGCAPAGNSPPVSLECTGLYSDLVAKRVAPAVRAFTPASPLWSDGAEKQRWIQLPAGSAIDNSRPTEWVFPVGTKVWKEFRHNGKRIETRFFNKTTPFNWVTATYLWNATDSATSRASDLGVDVPVSDGSYHVPSTEECEQCHRGSKDRLLGFSNVLLGLSGAQGITLETLKAEGLLTQPPAVTQYQIPDDGTQLADPALRWLHVNCGVSCHNENENAQGYISKMFLRLDPSALTSAPVRAWVPLMTTLGQKVYTANFPGATRIVPGFPDDSLVLKLAATRGFQQMPPIASKRVDETSMVVLREWVRRLAPDAGTDAGAPLDAGPGDASVDAAVVVPPVADAAVQDTAVPPVEDAAVTPVEDAAVPPVEDAAVPPVEPAVEDAAVPPVEPPVEDAAVPPVEDAAVPPVEPPVEDAAVPPVDPAVDDAAVPAEPTPTM